MIRSFDSIAAFRSACIAHDATRGYGGSCSDSWVGGETASETFQRAEFGDASLVPDAEAMIARLEAQIETPRRTWSRSPAGAFPCVPEAIAGFPTPMRRAIETSDERAPITIMAISTSSAGIPAHVLMKRGTAILALVLALARIRPISLHTLSILDGRNSKNDKDNETVFCSRINTTPLDLANACYVLTSAGFDRRLCHGLAWQLNGYTGTWPGKFRYGHPTGNGYYDYLAEQLAPDPKRALVIGAAQLHDPIITSPITWINDQIRRFTQAQEEEYAQ